MLLFLSAACWHYIIIIIVCILQVNLMNSFLPWGLEMCLGKISWKWGETGKGAVLVLGTAEKEAENCDSFNSPRLHTSYRKSQDVV